MGHVRCVDDGRIPKYILYGELALGRRTTGHPHLRYKDVCVIKHLKTGKDKLMTDAADKRARTKEDSSSMTCLVYMS